MKCDSSGFPVSKERVEGRKERGEKREGFFPSLFFCSFFFSFFSFLFLFFKRACPSSRPSWRPHGRSRIRCSRVSDSLGPPAALSRRWYAGPRDPRLPRRRAWCAPRFRRRRHPQSPRRRDVSLQQATPRSVKANVRVWIRSFSFFFILFFFFMNANSLIMK